MKLIKRVILLIVASLILILALYFYSYRQSVSVIENQINSRNDEKLAYFLNRIEGLLDQNMLFASLMAKDPEVKRVSYGNLPPAGYDRLNVIQSMEYKLNLFSITNQIMNIISIYFPKYDLALSSVPSMKFNQAEIASAYTSNWKINTVEVSGVKMEAFSRFFVSPFQAEPPDLTKADFIIRVDFFTKNITNVLDEFKLGGYGDAFFYHSEEQMVYNSTAKNELIRQVMGARTPGIHHTKGQYHEIVEVDDKKYILYVLPSNKIDWSLMDIEPLDEILQPVVDSRNLFGLIMFLLLLLGIIAAFLLYFYIQVPIRILIRSVEHIRNQDFSYRIHSQKRNEFQQLFDSFNNMVKEIDHLIKRVYTEEIRSREAVMKQLQSQINPHFLYNCLAYIVNMAKLNKNNSIIAMAHSLGDYYKYTTRNETLETTLWSEIELAVNYMDIMNHQLDKFRYTLSIPEAMKNIKIPRLIIQPVIENAIVHGLEEVVADGLIVIKGLEEADSCRLIIEDNGPGLSAEEIEELTSRTEIDDNLTEQTGLWNVHHRLKYYFGEHSGIRLAPSALGGLKIELYWEKVERE
ncbi:histidine kinase [Paenibacillus sp. MMS20-IR301]|uniref:sensor histidine kinase n=1 Tax=Paenibacillus sp. MMS20-IR301 TaxID=2895946 RepID=UPI0028E46C87|nr:histidine kinase [Paenibacillus sp. MMS20-IR301]WNS45155.1 histidine kinase [Paenibacillus sp. MMS20-IR301]